MEHRLHRQELRVSYPDSRQSRRVCQYMFTILNKLPAHHIRESSFEHNLWMSETNSLNSDVIDMPSEFSIMEGKISEILQIYENG